VRCGLDRHWRVLSPTFPSGTLDHFWPADAVPIRIPPVRGMDSVNTKTISGSMRPTRRAGAEAPLVQQLAHAADGEVPGGSALGDGVAHLPVLGMKRQGEPGVPAILAHEGRQQPRRSFEDVHALRCGRRIARARRAPSLSCQPGWDVGATTQGLDRTGVAWPRERPGRRPALRAQRAGGTAGASRSDRGPHQRRRFHGAPPTCARVGHKTPRFSPRAPIR
jgi:hypothetical protein